MILIEVIEELAWKIKWTLSSLLTAIGNPFYSFGLWVEDVKDSWTSW